MKPKTQLSDFAKICISLYPEDLQKLRERAFEEERDVSYYVRQAVHSYLGGA